MDALSARIVLKTNVSGRSSSASPSVMAAAASGGARGRARGASPRRRERQRLAADVEARRAERLVEEPVPRAPARDGLLGEDLLLGLGQDVPPRRRPSSRWWRWRAARVGRERAGRPRPARPTRRPRTGGPARCGCRLADPLEQRAARRVLGVRAPREVGVGAGAARRGRGSRRGRRRERLRGSAVRLSARRDRRDVPRCSAASGGASASARARSASSAASSA